SCVALASAVPHCYSPSFPPRRSSDLLQGFDVTVGQDRGDQFAFLFFRPRNGSVLLEFPLASLTVPCAPSAVPVAAGSVLISACRSEEHTSELQSRFDLVCRLLLEKKE